jgi:hypothetical protein
METPTIEPTTPPAMAAEFTLLPFEGGGVGNPVEEALEEEVTDAFEGPMIEPGPNSGESPT